MVSIFAKKQMHSPQELSIRDVRVIRQIIPQFNMLLMRILSPYTICTQKILQFKLRVLQRTCKIDSHQRDFMDSSCKFANLPRIYIMKENGERLKFTFKLNLRKCIRGKIAKNTSITLSTSPQILYSIEIF